MTGPQPLITAVKVDGIHTDIVITPYTNRVFIVITQTGTMGTLVNSSSEKNFSSLSTLR